MKSKMLKLFIVLSMLISQLHVVPFAIHAESATVVEDSDTSFEGEIANELDEVESPSEEETEADSEMETAEYDPETEVEADVEEETDVSEDLAENLEEDAEVDFERTAARTPGSGLVQFELRPTSWPSGVTEAQARTALMNVQSVTHDLLPVSGGSSHNSYTNGAFGRDALYLGETSTHYRIYYAGFEGLVAKEGATGNVTVNINGTNRSIGYRRVAVYYPFGSYAAGQGRTGSETIFSGEINLLQSAEQTIPFVEDDVFLAKSSGAQVRSASYYVNRGGTLIRVSTGNVAANMATEPWGHTVGPAPSWMAQNTAMYSYDGIYFYQNPRDIRPDGSGAINANNSHYNYFQNLSFRSQSNHSGTELNNYILSQLTGNDRINSKMVGTGADFINAQSAYGVNAMLQFAFAIHESDRGLSNIARNNNNLFGINAVDSNPAGNANSFHTVRDGINEHADHWISRGYLSPSDWRYAGPHLGNKGSGMNIRYASDPYWGEKIAGWAFRLDQSLNGRDLNNYTIGILERGNNVNVINESGNTLYTAGRGFRHFPFLIVGETQNQRQIRTDIALLNNVANVNAFYDRATAIGNIPRQTNLKFVGGTNGTPPSLAPTFDDSTLVRSGQTRGDVNFRRGPGTSHELIRRVAGGTNLTILAESNGWYQVKIGNQTGWINSKYIDVLNLPGQPTGTVNFRTGPGTRFSSIRQLSRGTSLTILGESNGWYQVRVGNQTGWINSNNVEAMTLNGQPTGTVNFRTGPGTRFSSMRTVAGRTNLIIIGESNGWYQVKIGNQTGWINANNVDEVSLLGQPTGTVNFRTGPGTRFSSIRTVSGGTNLLIVGESNGWYQVKIGNQMGWINANNVKAMTLIGQPTGTVNFRTGPGTKFSSTRTVSGGTTLTLLVENNGWYQVRIGSQIGWVNANNVNEMNLSGQTAGNVNFRTGPGTRFSSMGTVTRGTNLLIAGESNGWYRVKIGNRIGWINANNVNEASVSGQTAGNVNFRTGPGTRFSSIRTVIKGTNLQIIGESNGWYQVRIGTQTGWINSNNINSNF